MGQASRFPQSLEGTFNERARALNCRLGARYGDYFATISELVCFEVVGGVTVPNLVRMYSFALSHRSGTTPHEKITVRTRFQAFPLEKDRFWTSLAT